jgi:hypothetical protein
MAAKQNGGYGNSSGKFLPIKETVTGGEKTMNSPTPHIEL